MGIRHIHMQCRCGEPAHVVRVSLETERGARPELYIEPLLNRKLSFWSRLWVAFRYLFGFDTAGAFCDVLVDDESVDALTSVIARRNVIVRLQKALKQRKLEGIRQDEGPVLKTGGA